MSRMFANGPGGQDSIFDRVIPKTQEMVLDDTLLSTWYNMVWINRKVEQFREWSSAFPSTTV